MDFGSSVLTRLSFSTREYLHKISRGAGSSGAPSRTCNGWCCVHRHLRHKRDFPRDTKLWNRELYLERDIHFVGSVL